MPLAAPPESSIEQQWSMLDNSCDLLSVAPDDEVLAEILALQSELAQQVGACLVHYVGVPLQRAVLSVF